MSNKKVVASVAASLSLLAAPSARGMGLLSKLGVATGIGVTMCAGYKLLTAADVIDLLKKIDWKNRENISSTFRTIVDKVFKECGGGIYKVTSGAKKGYYFVIAEVKDTFGKVKSVVVSSTSKENLGDQLARLETNGAVIDGECIEEVSDFFGKTLVGKSSLGDKVGEATKIVINFFIRSFMNKFFGYSSVNYIGAGIKILQMADKGLPNVAGDYDNMPVNKGTILKGLPNEEEALKSVQNLVLNNPEIMKEFYKVM